MVPFLFWELSWNFGTARFFVVRGPSCGFPSHAYLPALFQLFYIKKRPSNLALFGTSLKAHAPEKNAIAQQLIFGLSGTHRTHHASRYKKVVYIHCWQISHTFVLFFESKIQFRQNFHKNLKNYSDSPKFSSLLQRGCAKRGIVALCRIRLTFPEHVCHYIWQTCLA